ncbi:MAG: cobalamin transport system substrate-binding protein [Eubacteriales bacterium]|nr:cobalamin transport system substrate-binding protein [Eubacteriales bacterium]MDN5363149.1 cobalamin transport system substrate-binding protein [Eubacteriales bacterium]
MKGRKSLVLAAVLVFTVAALLFAGCSFSGGGSKTSKETAEKVTYPLTLKDASGREVKIEKEPARIVSLTPSNTEIIFALGLGDKLVGVTKWDKYPPEVKNKKVVGDLNPSAEKVMELNPDLVVASPSLNKNAVEALRQAGVTVLTVEANTMADVNDSIMLIAKATNRVEEGKKLIAKIDAKIKEITEKVAKVKKEERPRVFIEVGSEPLFTAGKNTYLHDLVEKAGGINVAADVNSWAQYSEEKVVEKNPDVIIATEGYYIPDLKEKIKARPGWQNIKAVKENRIVTDIDPDLINHPGPRVAEALEAVAKALYPQLFQK